jgi:hypothetical protein
MLRIALAVALLAGGAACKGAKAPTAPVSATPKDVIGAAKATVESRFTVSRGGKTDTRLAAHRIYTYRELVKMLGAAGFSGFEAFGAGGHSSWDP